MSWIRPSGALIAVGALLLSAASGSARDVSDRELRSLASAASANAPARATLAQVSSVEGRPVDLAPALADDTFRARRLSALELPASRVDAVRLAAVAKSLVRPREDPRRSTDGWRPFSGRGFGGWPAWLASLLIIAVGFVVAVVITRRRAGAVESETIDGALTGGAHADPDELDRRATHAEREGDGRVAIRLRFQAGLIRLGRAGALAYRPSLTTREASEQLGSSLFDPLARTFEEVTYGGRDATADDLAAARETWPVLTGRPE